MGWSVQRDLSKTLVPTCGFQLELNGTHAQTVCVLQPQRAQGFDGYFYGDDSHADSAHRQRQHLDRLVKVRRYSDTLIAFLGHLPRTCKALQRHPVCRLLATCGHLPRTCKALLTSRPLIIATGRRLKLQQRVTATA